MRILEHGLIHLFISLFGYLSRKAWTLSTVSYPVTMCVTESLKRNILRHYISKVKWQSIVAMAVLFLQVSAWTLSKVSYPVTMCITESLKREIFKTLYFQSQVTLNCGNDSAFFPSLCKVCPEKIWWFSILGQRKKILYKRWQAMSNQLLWLTSFDN